MVGSSTAPQRMGHEGHRRKAMKPDCETTTGGSMRGRLVVAAGILLAAPLGAQEDVAFRAGIGISSLSGREGHSTTGPVVGVDVGFPAVAGLSLRPGLFYVDTGAESRWGSGVLLSGLSIGYLQTSLLLAQPRLIGSRRLSVGVQAGPWLAIKVACNTYSRTGSSMCGAPDGIQAMDFGVKGGLGISYGVMDGARISIDAVYHRGFADIIVHTPTIGLIIVPEHAQQTRVLSLQLGVVWKT